MNHVKEAILVVEDYPLTQKIHKMLLNSLGYAVDVAENGHQALALFNKNRYACIFMDIGLPDIDGYALTRAIRSTVGEKKDTPIIALTAHMHSKSQKEAKKAGMNDFLSKPLTAESAKSILRQYVK